MAFPFVTRTFQYIHSMKSCIPILILALCGIQLSAQINPDSLAIVDYHVHIFSPELIKSLARQGFDMHRDGYYALVFYKHISSVLCPTMVVDIGSLRFS
jgi:hypothetical protein